MRYEIVPGSQSGHCCFDFTIVDTTKPRMLASRKIEGEFTAVCECFFEEDAQKICNALNLQNIITKGVGNAVLEKLLTPKKTDVEHQ